MIVGAHLQFLRAAGGLWRDEVNSLNLAATPSMFSNWLRYQHDSFPIGWFVILRGWIECFSASDASLRIFGFLVGILLLVATWVAAREFGARTPTVSLALFAFSATTIRYGDSIRGYGLGMLMAVVTLITYWRVCQKPGVARVAVASVCGLLSVHFTFYNPVVLLAVTIAAAVLLARDRRWTTVGVLFSAGLVAALSLLIYLPLIRARSGWSRAFRTRLDAEWLLRKLVETVNSSGRSAAALWFIAILAAVIVVAVRSHAAEGRMERRAIEFCAIAGGLGAVFYMMFLYILSYPMTFWYFCVGLAVSGVCLDGILSPRQNDRPSFQSAVLLFVATAFVLCVTDVFEFISRHQTNVDLASRLVSERAKPGDLVIVFPWMNGVTFQRYYRGRAPWETLPPMADHTVHRYDLMIDSWSHEERVTRLRDAALSRIAAGGTVWLVTATHFPLRRDVSLPAFERGSESFHNDQALTQVALPLALVSVPCGPSSIFEEDQSLLENVRVECRRARTGSESPPIP